MESAVGVSYVRWRGINRIRSRRALVRYADDFVIFAETREDAEAAKSDIERWLANRGLELSQEKTRIRHLTEGFDFLGFNVRQYPQTECQDGVQASDQAEQGIGRGLQAPCEAGLVRLSWPQR